MRRIQRIRRSILLLFVMLVALMLPVTALAEETSAGKFILVAEAGGKLVIAPEYISYTQGQTLGEALQASDHVFTGLDTGSVTAIDDVTGTYTRSDQNGGYDLTTPASSVTHFCFSERSSSESKPTEGMKLLMTAMAEYLIKDADVQKVAKTAYTAAYSSFVGITNDDARTLAYELNKAISDYENTQTGTHYTLSFTDGTEVYSNANYSGVSITAVNPYGKKWEDDGDGKLQLPVDNYTFRLSHDGLAVSGIITVAEDSTVKVTLPQEQWLKLDTFRLSGSYGAETNEEHKFTDPGVEIVLENVLETEPQWLLDIVRGVDDPRLKLCLDVGHVNAYSKIPVTDWVESWAPYLSHFHIHNNDTSRDQHNPLNEGTIDMKELLEHIDRLCPDATITLELMKARTSVQWLMEENLWNC